MPNASKTIIKVSIVALAMGLSVGCATQGTLEEVRAEAQRASSLASQAQSTANAAQQTANEARSMAADAQACCRENQERIDRMFKRSMYK